MFCMFFADVEDAFFIKQCNESKAEGTYFRSIYGSESYNAVIEFIEWLLGEDFDVTKVDEYVKKIKGMGYKYVLCPSEVKAYYGDSDNVLESGVSDDAIVSVLFEDTNGVQICKLGIDKFTMYKLVNDYEGNVLDSIMYVVNHSVLKDIESYILNAF